MWARGFFLSGGICFTLSLLPLFWALMHGNFYGTISALYIEPYYTPLMVEVSEGHPLAGNPWYFEHRDDIGPTFILPYWISAFPLLVGVPLEAAVVVNFSVFSTLFGVLLYLLLRHFGVVGISATLVVAITYLASFELLLRPIAMMLVYPALLLFLLSFFSWYSSPTVRKDLFLGLTTALGFYMYGFLLQVLGIFLVLVFLMLVIKRDWNKTRHTLLVGLWTTLFSIPFVATTFIQITNPNYLETMMRTGLVLTHTPDRQAYYLAASVLAFVGLVFFIRRWSVLSRSSFFVT